jgi:hypothetical protein
MNDAQTYDQFVTRYAAQREKTLICLFLGEFATIFDNILGEYQGPRWDYLMKKKTRGRKSLDALPFWG